MSGFDKIRGLALSRGRWLFDGGDQARSGGVNQRRELFSVYRHGRNEQRACRKDGNQSMGEHR